MDMTVSRTTLPEDEMFHDLVVRLCAAKRGGRARSQPGCFTGWLRGGWWVAGSSSGVMLAWPAP